MAPVQGSPLWQTLPTTNYESHVLGLHPTSSGSSGSGTRDGGSGGGVGLPGIPNPLGGSSAGSIGDGNPGNDSGDENENERERTTAYRATSALSSSAVVLFSSGILPISPKPQEWTIPLHLATLPASLVPHLSSPALWSLPSDPALTFRPTTFCLPLILYFPPWVSLPRLR